MIIKHKAKSRRRTISCFLLPLLAGGAVMGAAGCAYSNPHTETCTVTEKDRTRGTEGASEMRIYTEQCGTLVIEDMLFNGQFNAGDMYGQIKPGKTYEFGVSGVRLEFFSEFPKITSIKEVKA